MDKPNNFGRVLLSKKFIKPHYQTKSPTYYQTNMFNNAPINAPSGYYQCNGKTCSKNNFGCTPTQHNFYSFGTDSQFAKNNISADTETNKITSPAEFNTLQQKQGNNNIYPHMQNEYFNTPADSQNTKPENLHNGNNFNNNSFANTNSLSGILNALSSNQTGGNNILSSLLPLIMGGKNPQISELLGSPQNGSNPIISALMNSSNPGGMFGVSNKHSATKESKSQTKIDVSAFTKVL